MNKYLIWALAFILLLDCAATIGLYLSVKDKPLEREDYQMFKVVKIPADTVYVDPVTIGTTTDPDNF
jgi:hypothetical protein